MSIGSGQKANPVVTAQTRAVAHALDEVRSLLQKIRRADEYSGGYSIAELIQNNLNEIGAATDTTQLTSNGLPTRFAELSRLESVTTDALDAAVPGQVALAPTEDADSSGTGIG